MEERLPEGMRAAASRDAMHRSMAKRMASSEEEKSILSIAGMDMVGAKPLI